jgi:N-terminal domain of reverse transcriptase
MTAACSAGATSHAPLDWPQINWHAVHRNVRRLQARIVQATQVGRWGKVHALQQLLTHSFSGKALAVRRVTDNHGNRTPGVDGETWSTPAQKTMAIDALRRRGSHPRPLRRVYIPKSNGTRRPLGIPMSHAYCLSLQRRLGIAVVAPTSMNAIDQLTQYNELGEADQVSSGKNRSESVRITSKCSGLLTSTPTACFSVNDGLVGQTLMAVQSCHARRRYSWPFTS